MTLYEFWNDVKSKKGVDYDKMYGKQCVDLINAYIEKVFGIKGACYGVQYAYEVYSKLTKTHIANWQRIPMVKDSLKYVNYGDIIIWKKERNGYAGHIAIVKSCTDKNITVYEQNYDGKGGIREHTYDYTNVLGFILIPDEYLNKVCDNRCICDIVKCNATINTDSNTYKTNLLDTKIGEVKRGERVRVLKKGVNIAIIQYGITRDVYATGCILNKNIVFD